MAFEAVPISEAIVVTKMMSAAELKEVQAGEIENHVFVAVSQHRWCIEAMYIMDWRASIPITQINFFRKYFRPL